MSDYDSPWKEALDQLFPAFAALCFPRVHTAVNWSRGYEALDKELQQVIREAEVGRRYADKLFKVWLHDGQEAWILIHVEVQNQRDDNFPERMFVYHYRLYDRFRRPVVSLAVLGDEDPDWRPHGFGYNVCDCSLALEFPIVKLLDYAGRIDALEASDNPFAPFVLAHLKTMETRQDTAARRGWKIRLIKGLYERGLGADQLRQLFRLIDWIMDLPPESERELHAELARFEEEKHMPYVTSIERFAHERGKAEGKAEAKAETLLQVLNRAGPGVPADLDARIRGTNDLAQLERWLNLALQTPSLDEFRRQAQL